MGEVRGSAETASKIDSESSLQFSISKAGDSPESNVVNSQRGVVLRTAFECDLEFTPEVLVELIPDQESEHRISIREHVEGFVVRSAGPIASSDVSDCISARLARRYATFSKEAKKIRGLLQTHVVQLRVFTRCKMDE